MDIREQAKELGIKVDGRWSDERVQSEIDKVREGDYKEPESKAIEDKPKESDVNNDGFKAGAAVSNEDLMRYMAIQRQKEGIQKATNPKPVAKRKKQGKVHGAAVSKAK